MCFVSMSRRNTELNKVRNGHNALILFTNAFVSAGAPVYRMNRLLIAGDETATASPASVLSRCRFANVRIR